MTTKRITSILPVLSLFFLIGLATHAQATTYSFKSLDPPGAGWIEATSINASGQVVGRYRDASHIDTTHGFMYSEGQFTSLDAPGARYTAPTSLNARGQVVGHYIDDSDVLHGFVYSEGQFTSLDVPGARYTEVTSINVSGQVVGYYVNDAPPPHGSGAGPCEAPSPHGFVYSDGNFTFLDDVPGDSLTSINTGARPTSINTSGQVVGSYYDCFSDAGHGFVYSEGQFTPFNPLEARCTYLTSINASGQVVGYYPDASHPTHSHGFIATPMTPFNLFDVAVLMVVLDSKAKKNDENQGTNSEAAEFESRWRLRR